MHAEEAQGGAGRGVIFPMLQSVAEFFTGVFLWLYERSERRVVGEWEVVPVHAEEAQGSAGRGVIFRWLSLLACTRSSIRCKTWRDSLSW